MTNDELDEAFRELSTPLICDACLRLEAPFDVAPAGIRPLRPSLRCAGRALPVRHHGSVDVFLEAIERAGRGDVLVIDNGGRLDEGCIGDLTVLEAQAAGLRGVILWGAHRDTPELDTIGLPVFSCGSCPSGPRRLDPRPPDALDRAPFGTFEVDAARFVAADADGVVFAPLARAREIVDLAQTIRRTERAQADAVRSGTSLRDQLRFGEYLEARRRDPSHTFRQHLRRIGGAIEE